MYGRHGDLKPANILYFETGRMTSDASFLQISALEDFKRNTHGVDKIQEPWQEQKHTEHLSSTYLMG
jgi:hypothetical protein